MRTISGAAETALNSGRFGVRCLLKAEVDSGNFCIWDDYGSLLVGGDTYTGAVGRFTVTGVTSEKSATVPNIDVALSGLDASVVSVVQNEAWPQRPITIQRLIFAIETPQVLHVMPEFVGFLDHCRWSEQEESTLIFRAESASRELARNYVRTRSDADQRQRDASDPFLEFAQSTITEPMNWGARPAKAPKLTGIYKYLDKWF